MTSAEALEAVRRHFESQFPKTCTTCGRRFATLREHLLRWPVFAWDGGPGDLRD